MELYREPRKPATTVNAARWNLDFKISAYADLADRLFSAGKFEQHEKALDRCWYLGRLSHKLLVEEIY